VSYIGEMGLKEAHLASFRPDNTGGKLRNIKYIGFAKVKGKFYESAALPLSYAGPIRIILRN